MPRLPHVRRVDGAAEDALRELPLERLRQLPHREQVPRVPEEARAARAQASGAVWKSICRGAFANSLFDLLTGRELIKAQKAEAAENLGILRDGGAREL